jgi:hypothetical protein
MTWIQDHQSFVGHEVRLGDRRGIAIGWIRYEGDLVGPWRAWCRISTCHELGGGYTRTNAAELVREHWLVEHR